MRAAVITEFNKPISIKKVDIPKPGRGEVLVKMHASGLCSTDQHILEGRIPTVKLPHIPGHEGAGEVVELGEDIHNINLGDRVVAAIYVTCGKCFYCLNGQENMCINVTRIGFERPGFHAEYVCVPESNLFYIPDKVSFSEAAVMPDAAACMLHAIRRKANVQAGDMVVIVGGTGGLGMQGIQLLKLMGAKVAVTSRSDERLGKTVELGADFLINSKKEDWVQKVLELTDGQGADVVIDNVGLNNTIDQGISAVRRGGKIIVVGYWHDRFEASLFNLFMNEIEIIGCRASHKRDLFDVLKWTAEGKFKPFISKTYNLTEINEALRDLAEGKYVGRAVLAP